MITNQNEINKYSQINKQYLPNEYINNNYIYSYNGDYIHIIKDTNCYYNYQTQYCDCNNYNWKTNVMEITYSCRRSDQYSSIAIQQLTSDISYSEPVRDYYIKDKACQIGMILIGILFAMLLLRERKSL